MQGAKLIISILHFNSHAHVERDRFKPLLDITPIDFNSHAHVERDCHCVTRGNSCHISTHTLTWSVTFAFVLSCEQYEYFNSHAHVERDP